MKKDALILVRGGGDLATGTIHRLWSAGLRVLVLEAEHPAAIRRQVALSEAVYAGSARVEDVEAVRMDVDLAEKKTVGNHPMTVWYHPDASWTTVKANWRLESDPKTLGRNVDMDKVKDGWYRLTIPDTKGSRVAVTFTDMKRLDNNANRNYVVSGGSMAVSGGQVIGDVTPNCAITNKQ